MKLIPLTKGYTAMVDEADYETVNQFKWYANETKRGFLYALRGIRQPKISVGVYGKVDQVLMHNFIMNSPDGIQVRHLDGNGLNNQRDNLVIALYQDRIKNNRPEIKIDSILPSFFKGKYSFEEMSVWDSFFIEAKEGQKLSSLRGTLMGAAKYYCAKNNLEQKFESIIVNNGVRIWRTS